MTFFDFLNLAIETYPNGTFVFGFAYTLIAIVLWGALCEAIKGQK